MKKNVTVALLAVVCIVGIGFGAKNLMGGNKTNNTPKSIYYNLHPVSNDSTFSIFDDQIDNGYNEDYDKEIKNLENVKNVYEYMGLAFGNYYDTNGEVHDISLKNDTQNKTIDVTSIEQTFLILPYFEEDGLDKDMSKVFMSKELSQFLSDNGLTNKGDYEIDHVRIPNGRKVGETTHIDQNNNKINYDANEIQFEYKGISLSFDAVLDQDYYEPIYESKYVVLVPYTQFKELLGNFEPATRKVYVDSKLSTEEMDALVKEIKAVGEDIRVLEWEN